MELKTNPEKLEYFDVRRLVVEIIIQAAKDYKRGKPNEKKDAKDWILSTGKIWAEIIDLNIQIEI
ncbi:MAG: hypothetical protein ACYDH1_15955 [Anaerolineaceae bacterium]